MQCLTPSCKGLVVWEPKDEFYPAHHRCANCGRRYNARQVAEIKRIEKGIPKAESVVENVPENILDFEAEKEKPMEEKTKICNKCGEVKPLQEFHINRACKDGLETTCKACKSQKAKERWKRWKESHPRAERNARKVKIERKMKDQDVEPVKQDRPKEGMNKDEILTKLRSKLYLIQTAIDVIEGLE